MSTATRSSSAAGLVASSKPITGNDAPQRVSRWCGSLRQQRTVVHYASSLDGGVDHCETAAVSETCVITDRKRRKVSQIEKVPVKPLPEAAAARTGPALKARLALMAAAECEQWPPGTRLWAKLRGSCAWPAVMWSSGLCRKLDIPELTTEFRPGQVLVRCYGEHSSMWCCPGALAPWLPPPERADDPRLARMLAWGKANSKMLLVEATLIDMAASEAEPGAELARMQRLAAGYAKLPAGASRHLCAVCKEVGAALRCGGCDRAFHSLCLAAPVLAAADLVPGSHWFCASCLVANQVLPPENPQQAEATRAERMGLTPDWIIEAGAYGVFGLDRPTPAKPYIAGLLDPCTNSHTAPNIPAEKLYDQQDNGLKMSNSWAGFHIILNPEYSQQILWRFVNRAIDEVENDRVPACLLIVRNSTDTGYYQRLQPYPRVLLRRSACRFKDYDDLPIAWGVIIFCIAKHNVGSLYPRFYEAFAAAGEASIPVDAELLRSDAFAQLLVRLRLLAAQYHRDHWVLCSACGKWRILEFAAMQAVDMDSKWTCSQLGPGFSCASPQSKRELRGTRYVAAGPEPNGAMYDFCGSNVPLAAVHTDGGFIAAVQPADAASLPSAVAGDAERSALVIDTAITAGSAATAALGSLSFTATQSASAASQACVPPAGVSGRSGVCSLGAEDAAACAATAPGCARAVQWAGCKALPPPPPPPAPHLSPARARQPLMNSHGRSSAEHVAGGRSAVLASGSAASAMASAGGNLHPMTPPGSKAMMCGQQQELPPLEAARQANIAANHAFMASLQLGARDHATDAKVAAAIGAAGPPAEASARQLMQAVAAAAACPRQQYAAGLQRRQAARAAERRRLVAALQGLDNEEAADVMVMTAARTLSQAKRGLDAE